MIWQPAVSLTHTLPSPLLWVRHPHPPTGELTRFTQSPADVPVLLGGTLSIRGGFREFHRFTATTYLCEILITWAAPEGIRDSAKGKKKRLTECNHKKMFDPQYLNSAVPVQGAVWLHWGRLTESSDPTQHILLSVSTEEIRAHSLVHHLVFQRLFTIL